MNEGPWLVADVGGTNARFALVDGPDGVPSRVKSLPTREHAGLARIHRYLAPLDGGPAEDLTAKEICERPGDPRCRETLHMFCALLGSHAGKVALTLGARGGVYLGGGVLPRIADVLRGSAFRARFEGKPPVEDYLRGIPSALIVHPGPALTGAAVRLAQSLPDLEPA